MFHRKLGVRYTSDTTYLEKELENQHGLVLTQEEMLGYQKSKEQWVEFGNIFSHSNLDQTEHEYSRGSSNTSPFSPPPPPTTAMSATPWNVL